jgi:hypothetical protein
VGKSPPSRPSNVVPSAVFLWAPATPFPASKLGDWVNCWFDQNGKAIRCRVTNQDGRVRYEGVFRSYPDSSVVVDRSFPIDASATGDRFKWLYVKDDYVPIIHLRGGSILIPAEEYERGKEEVEKQIRSQQVKPVAN